MNVNVSFLGQMLTFAILVWVTMKYVWPPLMAAITQRNKEISDGLAAGEQGRQQLADANERQKELLTDARNQASTTMREGQQRRDEIVAAAAGEGEAAKEKIISEGRAQIEAERSRMVQELEQSYASLVVAGAEKILKREFDAKAHKDVVDSLIRTI